MLSNTKKRPGRSAAKTGASYDLSVLRANLCLIFHRNYDILAAVFTDVLKYMHDDLTVNKL